MTTCPCDLGLLHCHEPLVEHGDGTAECLSGCGGPRAVHDDVLPCADSGCTACFGGAHVAGSVEGGGRARPGDEAGLRAAA